MGKSAVQSPGDTDAELRSAICIYLIAERREGATIGELARLKLGGNPATEEVPRVSKAVSALVEEGEIKIERKTGVSSDRPVERWRG
jgi:hypothetical protein